LIDWRDDGAGGRVRFLADVDGIRSETHVYSSWFEHRKSAGINRKPDRRRSP
jgi:hypothetical protein